MKTVMFIHGMFVNSKSWEQWLPYFEKRGYKVLAPDWPHHRGEPSWLREHIAPELGRLRLTELVDSYAGIIQRLPEKPILVGHSMGGLVAQLLVARGLAEEAACISTAPPQGLISLKPSFIISNFPTINPLAGNSPSIMTPGRFHYAFCNTMTMDEAKQAFERYVVPETRNVARSSASRAGRIDFKKPHVPLLFVSGKEDHIIPTSLNARNVRRYHSSAGRVTCRVFPGRSHFICNQKGWEEVASCILEWLATSETKP